MNINVKELERIGAGIMRFDLIKRTLRGNIYQAQIYRNDKTIRVSIMYFRRGGSRIAEVLNDNTQDSRLEFQRIINEIIRERARRNDMMKKDLELNLISVGIGMSYIFTALNTISIRKPTDIIYVMIDLLLLAVIRMIYRREKKRYE